MYACNYLENGFLNVLRGITFSAPSKCYLALYINDPGESGTAGTEISYAGYVRKEITFSEPAASDSGIAIQNISDITFPTPETAAGTITHIGVLDSLSGGNMLVRSELSEPLVIGAKEPPVFLAGDVMFYFGGALSSTYKTKILNVLRGQTLNGVTPCFSLWNGSPEDSGAELAGTNYSRVPLTFSSPSEQSSGQLLVSNSAAASFNRPSTAWGTWSWSAIYSAVTGGEPIFCIERTESIDVKRGYMPTFDVGAIRLGIN